MSLVRKIVPLVFVIAGILPACKDKPKSGPDQGPALAVVNGNPITASEFKQAAARHLRSKKFDVTTVEGKKGLLEELISEEVVFQEALREKLYNDPGVKRRLIRLQTAQLTRDDKYQPTDADITKYYDANKADLDRIRASHVLIKAEKSADAASQDEALKKAQGILKKIRAGESFEDLAKSSSADTVSAQRGGDLRYFDRSKMVPAFADAAFALKAVGDVSDVVKTDFGYHIIKLTGEQRGADVHKNRIRAKLLSDRRQSIQDEFTAKMRKKAKVTINDKLLVETTIDTSPPPGQLGMPGDMDLDTLNLPPEMQKAMQERMKPKP